jgi:hypothetical protein
MLRLRHKDHVVNYVERAKGGEHLFILTVKRNTNIFYMSSQNSCENRLLASSFLSVYPSFRMEKRHRMTHRRQISYLGFLVRLFDTFRLWLKSHRSNRKLRDGSL